MSAKQLFFGFLVGPTSLYLNETLDSDLDSLYLTCIKRNEQFFIGKKVGEIIDFSSLILLQTNIISLYNQHYGAIKPISQFSFSLLTMDNPNASK